MNLWMDEIISAAGHTLIVVAATFVILALLVSVIRFRLMFSVSEKNDSPEEEEKPDPFRAEIIQRLSTAHREPQPFSVMTLCLAESENSVHQEELIGRVKKIIRKSDIILSYDGNHIGLIIETSLQYAGLVAERICGRLADPAEENIRELKVHLGIATYPEDGERTIELLGKAEESLAKAVTEEKPFVLTTAKETRPDKPAPAPPQNILDELTGVLRGELLSRAVPKYINPHRKAGRTVAMLYIDMDDVSRYNKHYSREAGDALIQGVSDLLQKNLREDDLIARYEGDEFIILMPANEKEAMVAAKRLAALVRKTEFKYNDIILKTTVSIGLALVPLHARTAARLFDAASHALRVAQDRGVGFFVMYTPQMAHKPKLHEKTDKF